MKRIPTLVLTDLWEWDVPGDIIVNGFAGWGWEQPPRKTSYGGVAYLGMKYKITRAKPRAQ